jgi:hypothetical protein
MKVMKMVMAAMAVTAVAPISAKTFAAEPTGASPLVCPERWGKPGEPLVSREETAKTIFLAVETEFNPEADKARFAVVKASDEGDHWAVWRGSEPRQLTDGSWSVIMGGGQLSMNIAKCDAAISRVFYTK